MNILNKVWGSIDSGEPPPDDLIPTTRDALFEFQMGQEKPFALTWESLFVAKICGILYPILGSQDDWWDGLIAPID